MPTREDIIQRSNSLPDSTLLYYLNQGDVTINDLQATLPPDRLIMLQNSFRSPEAEAWERVVASNDLNEYRRFLMEYPNGEYAPYCRNVLNQNGGYNAPQGYQPAPSNGQYPAYGQQAPAYQPTPSNGQYPGYGQPGGYPPAPSNGQYPAQQGGYDNPDTSYVGFAQQPAGYQPAPSNGQYPGYGQQAPAYQPTPSNGQYQGYGQQAPAYQPTPSNGQYPGYGQQAPAYQPTPSDGQYPGYGQPPQPQAPPTPQAPDYGQQQFAGYGQQQFVGFDQQQTVPEPEPAAPEAPVMGGFDPNLMPQQTEQPQSNEYKQEETVVMDPEWLEACQQNTVEAYVRYQRSHPNTHTEEVESALESLRDQDDWRAAQDSNTIEAYMAYLDKHPKGMYTSQAHEYIRQARMAQTMLSDLQQDPNAHRADELRDMMLNNQLSFASVEQVFRSPIKAQAIASYYPPAPLIDASKVVTFPEKLQQGSTEVYFWGTPSSGKTCALGALLSASENRYSLDKQQCESYDYMTKLANVFKINNGLCNLPTSTASDRIEEMVFRIIDEKGRYHRMTLIDIAGEIFRSIYLKRNNMFVNQENEKTLNQLMTYLEDKGNNKIHFFVVEYGAHDRIWEGLSMKNYLEACSTYLQSGKIIRKNTNGVYIIVTKCDKMGCPPEEMPKRALDYVRDELGSFYDNLQIACNNAGIADFKVISFSIGDVFAQQLCVYNDYCTDKVLNVLLRKTYVEKDSWWQKVLNW